MAVDHYSERGGTRPSKPRYEDRYDDRFDDRRHGHDRNEARQEGQHSKSYYNERARVSYKDIDSSTSNVGYNARGRDAKYSSRSHDRSRSRSPYRHRDGNSRGRETGNDRQARPRSRERQQPSRSEYMTPKSRARQSKVPEEEKEHRNSTQGHPTTDWIGRSKDKDHSTAQGGNREDNSSRARDTGTRYVAPLYSPWSQPAECSYRMDKASTSNGNAVTSGAAQPEMEVEDATQELDEDAIIELRRKQREAVKAKFKNSAPAPLLIQALQAGSGSAPPTPDMQTPQVDSSVSRDAPTGQSPLPAPRSCVLTTDLASPLVTSPNTPDEMSTPGSAFALNEPIALNELSPANPGPEADIHEDGIDNENERLRRLQALAAKDAEKDTSPPSDVPTPGAQGTDVDMVADGDDDDDDIDMFADEPNRPVVLKKSSKPPKPTRGRKLDVGLLDNWDDPDGFYKTINRELIHDRYQVQYEVGKGMFASVVRALDEKTNELVAIKITRRNDMMKRAGQREIRSLQKLNEEESDSSSHVVRMLGSFIHKHHLCIVFENMDVSMRENLKKFGYKKGLPLFNVRNYCGQMFRGLALLKKCNLLHADLKPDNILAGPGGRQIKIADLGSAMDVAESEITEEIASRFYRAPEAIIGIKPSFPLDMWAMGCTLFEFFTDDYLFPGHTNNHMLRLIMECRGKISKKVLRRGDKGMVANHFDEHLERFINVKEHPRLEITSIAISSAPVIGKDIKARLAAAAKKHPTPPGKEELDQFRDLLEKCLKLDPDERITPNQALAHPFLRMLVPTKVPNKAPIKAPSKSIKN
jgi:serine/threonine-protein kinase PRP4